MGLPDHRQIRPALSVAAGRMSTRLWLQSWNPFRREVRCKDRPAAAPETANEGKCRQTLKWIASAALLAADVAMQ
ncbi:MAG: hypothetical protein DWQ09_11960 [Proteobacteria bacterium]|nr:MAG: hypothetical protein DWQ09_11960 [Pseudomonadota bacterium]